MQRESRSLICSGESERKSSILARVSTARVVCCLWLADAEAGGTDEVPSKPLVMGVFEPCRSGWSEASSIAEALRNSRGFASRLKCRNGSLQVEDDFPAVDTCLQ